MQRPKPDRRNTSKHGHLLGSVWQFGSGFLTGEDLFRARHTLFDKLFVAGIFLNTGNALRDPLGHMAEDTYGERG